MTGLVPAIHATARETFSENGTRKIVRLASGEELRFRPSPTRWTPGTSPIGAKLSGLVRFRCALSVMAGLVPTGAKLSGLVRFRCALSVMAGLVPAIHVERRWPVLKVGHLTTTWMPGTRPGMTESAALKLALMGTSPGMTRTILAPFDRRPVLQAV